MSVLHILNDKMQLGDSEQYITDLYSTAMYEIALSLFSEKDKQSIFSNELFQRYAVSYVTLQNYIESTDVSEIFIDKATTDAILPWLAVDVSQKLGKKISIKWNCSTLKYKTSIIHTRFLSLLAGIKLITELLRVKRTEINNSESKITIIRSKAAKGKISHIQGIEMLFERMEGGPSIYGLFPVGRRVKWIIQSVKESRQYNDEQEDIVKRLFGSETVKNVRYHYCLRNVHTYLYSVVIEALFKNIKKHIFVSGNNLDRYAILEEKMAKKYGIPTECIPHGLEYGFKLPHCFTGDVFYSTSEYAAVFLNKLYETNKFVFDQNIMTTVFKQNPVHHHGVNRIVFFTEPTENYINREILRILYEVAEEVGQEVWVKLHPKDDRKNYEGIDFIQFDDNYSDAICDNICIARKSTTLLEATYNNSKPCAVVLIGKDEIEFNTFPSLQSPLIHVARSKKDLRIFVTENCKP